MHRHHCGRYCRSWRPSHGVQERVVVVVVDTVISHVGASVRGEQAVGETKTKALWVEAVGLQRRAAEHRVLQPGRSSGHAGGARAAEWVEHDTARLATGLDAPFSKRGRHDSKVSARERDGRD